MTSATARGHVTGQEWRVTPQDDGTYVLFRPGESEPFLRCHPDKDFAVAIESTKPELYALEFWHGPFLPRVQTLVEAARINEQVKARKLVDYGDFSDSACGTCGRNPNCYLLWGTPCEREGCKGKYFPVKKNPAR